MASAEGWQLYHLHVPIVLKSGSLKLMEPSRPVQGWIYLLSVSCVGWKHNILHLYHLCNQDHTLLGCDMVLSGRWVPNKCWCLSSKLRGVTHHNITLFSPFLTMPLQHHMWKQGKFTVQSPDEVTETIHSSQQLSKQCEICWWRVQSSGMWLWCWVSSCYHFQQF
jgi:hypothetical protein